MPATATIRRIAIGIAVLMTCASASADIKSFNAAMKSRDFRTAAAEASSTWPALDKSRDDIAIIAREFGFAALMAGDFAAARTFGNAAVSSSAALGESPEMRAASDLLRDVAAHKLSPSASTRDQLYRSLQARATHEGLDLITYFAADIATAYDFERGAWKEAEASANLAKELSEQGGQPYRVQAFRFDLFSNVAEYLRTREVNVYGELGALIDRTIAEVNAAASDSDAQPFAQLYWEVHAWRSSIGSHLVGRRKMKWPEAPKTNPHKPDDRATRLLGFRTDDDDCVSYIDMRRDIEYPKSALYKGLIGVVILRIDIDAKGVATNPEIVTAVPDKYFGNAVLKSVDNIRFKKGDKWSEGCSLQQTGRVITFQFTVGG